MRWFLMAVLVLFSMEIFEGDIIVITKRNNVNNIAVKITLRDVYLVLCDLDIKHPDIVLKQVIQESGWGLDGGVAVQNNNLFGFQVDTDNVLRFNGWFNSAVYYKEWQDKYYTDTSINYYEFLQQYGYAEDSLYVFKLKGINVNKFTKYE